MPRDPLLKYPAFAAEVRARLERGRVEYRDESFERPLPELLQEIREELCDIAGWAFCAFVRLEALDERAHQADPPKPPLMSDPGMRALLALAREPR